MNLNIFGKKCLKCKAVLTHIQVQMLFCMQGLTMRNIGKSDLKHLNGYLNFLQSNTFIATNCENINSANYCFLIYILEIIFQHYQLQIFAS